MHYNCTIQLVDGHKWRPLPSAEAFLRETSRIRPKVLRKPLPAITAKGGIRLLSQAAAALRAVAKELRLSGGLRYLGNSESYADQEEDGYNFRPPRPNMPAIMNIMAKVIAPTPAVAIPGARMFYLKFVQPDAARTCQPPCGIDSRLSAV